MQHGNYSNDPYIQLNWRILNRLWPYLFRYKSRVLLALLCLILSKAAILVIPFFLKYLVDSLDSADPDHWQVDGLTHLVDDAHCDRLDRGSG